MINGLIKIEMFSLLDEIRKRHGVMDKDWAKEAGLTHGSRISELRAIAENRRDVADRAFHYQKWCGLMKGLQSILGEETVRKELVDLLAKAKTKEEKLVLLVSILSDDRKDQAISYLELLAQAPEKK